MQDTKIKEILLAQDYVSEKDVAEAEKYALSHHASFLEYFYQKQLISEELVHQAIAEYYKLPYFDLEASPPEKANVLLLPKESAEQYQALVVAATEKQIGIALKAPLSTEGSKALKAIFPKVRVILYYANPDLIDQFWRFYRPTLDTRFSQILQSNKRVAPDFVDQIITDALAMGASDIHCEPQEKEVLIRFRVDGVLHEAGRVPLDQYGNIVNRVKVLASLRIDEHQTSQDGSIHFSAEGKSSDLRISIVPTVTGEKLVLRVLSEYVRDFTLSDLGMSEQDQELINEAVSAPYGMVLVAGPTGSGKTTTLYSALKKLNDIGINITTIEDPVEYRIPGINQIQVNNQTNLTFAKGLRAIARQDPNVVLVGEIRDAETVDIAVNAALTGHLVLSTFHANDASSVIPRLLHMGIEPFLLASTLHLIIAQRLLRQICEKCRVSYSATGAALKAFQEVSKIKGAVVGPKATLYKGKGCSACNNTGFRGRVGVFEIIRVTPEMEEVILKNPASKEVWQLAKSQGGRSLYEDGLQKVFNGVTTFEELNRVVKVM